MPWTASQPIDYKEVCNYLIVKKAEPKDHHDHKQNACPMSELYPGQEVLFLSPTKPNSYIEGIITVPETMPPVIL